MKNAKPVAARNLVAKHDFNRGGAHRSAKDYVRVKPTVNDALDEYYEPLWDDEESMCDMLDIPYEDVYQSTSLIDFFKQEDNMKVLKDSVVALDIETRSRPKEAAFAGRIPTMTTFAFAAIVPDQELPELFIGKMDVVAQVTTPNIFHVEPDTDQWWLTSDRISAEVRASQLRLWNNEEMLFAAVGPVLNDTFNTGNTMSYVGSHQLEDVARIFRNQLGTRPHFLGNGPEFDMAIFDMHFSDHKIYGFTDVGSARSLKWLARQRFDYETFKYLEKNAEEYAKWVFSNLPMSLKETFDLVPNWHDSLYDALAEAHLSHAILTDAIN